jgi:hypothetical protein
VQAHADSLSLVRFDRNSYSVPTQYAHRQITVVGTVDEVRLIFENQLVARHERDWDKEQFHYEPLHYLALLERKPGSFDHAKPFEEWDLLWQSPERGHVVGTSVWNRYGHFFDGVWTAIEYWLIHWKTLPEPNKMPTFDVNAERWSTKNWKTC